MSAVRDDAPTMLTTLVRAAWLGFKIESNWADPFVFAVYSIVKPIAASLTIVVMYQIVTGGNTSGDLFVYAFLGSAFQAFFHNVLAGTAFVIIEDREFYETIVYVCVSPASFLVYLLGRSLIRFVMTALSVAVVLGLGRFAFGLAIDPAGVRGLVFLASLLLGLVCLTALGVALAGTMLLLSHRGWYALEGVAGLFFFFSGSIFPISQIPGSLRWISYLLPTTYWLDLLRVSLVPSCGRHSPFDAGPGPLLLAMAAITAASCVAGHLIFWRCYEAARSRGYIGRKTHF